MKTVSRKWCIIAIIAITAATIVIIGKNAAAADFSNPDYYELVKKLKNNDMNINFQALRLSYTKTQDYKPYGADDSAKDAAFAALNKKNFAEAASQAELAMENNFVDLNAHMMCRIAYREMGNSKKYNFHNAVLKGLVDSLYASGDGTTPEKAIVVISVPEEYFLLNANGLKSIRNTLFTQNSHNYDKMDVENKTTGEKTVIYFNIDIPYNWLNKNLQKR